MKTRELLSMYPIAGNIIMDHYKETMRGGANLARELEEFLTDEVVTKSVSVMLDRNPRALLDLLDKHEIYATVVIEYSNGIPSFKVDIDGAVSEAKFDNRHDAELHLLDNAIQMLNNKIS